MTLGDKEIRVFLVGGGGGGVVVVGLCWCCCVLSARCHSGKLCCPATPLNNNAAVLTL